MNHEDSFYQPVIGFMLGVFQLCFCFTFETINMIILFSKSNVYLTIVSYLTVNLLVELNRIYYQKTIGSDATNMLREVFSDENRLPILKKTQTLDMDDRTCLGKVMRFTYKLFRCLYASIIFYFVPFLYILYT
jgi:hypothetical protein